MKKAFDTFIIVFCVNIDDKDKDYEIKKRFRKNERQKMKRNTHTAFLLVDLANVLGRSNVNSDTCVCF